MARATVTAPYQDPRSKISRGGEQQWSVTTYDGTISRTERFWERAEADHAFSEAVEVGFEELAA